jgi:hypothetical protein
MSAAVEAKAACKQPAGVVAPVIDTGRQGGLRAGVPV